MNSVILSALVLLYVFAIVYISFQMYYVGGEEDENEVESVVTIADIGCVK
jgi:hypothetical protein